MNVSRTPHIEPAESIRSDRIEFDECYWSDAYVECLLAGDWYLVLWDGYEWLTMSFCRPHANLSLIYERQDS